MAIAAKEEEARRRILETKQPKSFTESYSPALKELKHTPPVREYIKTLSEATSPFAAVLTKERIKLDEQAIGHLKDVNSNLKKAFPKEISLVNNAIAEIESRLETAKRTQKVEDYKLFYADFAKVSRAVNHLAEAAVKGEMLKGKALETAKKALDITYSISEFVVPPVMIAGKMTGAKEEKITKVDKAIIAVSFVPFAGVAVKTARLGKGAVLAARAVVAAEEAAQASRVAKESAFLSGLATRAKVAAAIGQKETSITDKFVSLSKDASIYLRDAKSSLKAFQRTNDMNKLDRARLSGQEAARRLGMAKEVVQRELGFATKAKDVNAIGQAKHLLNEIAVTEKGVNAFRIGADETARVTYDVKFLTKLAEGAKAAQAFEFPAMNSIRSMRTTFASPKLLSEMMDRTLSSEKGAVVLKQVFNVSDINKLNRAQRSLFDSYSKLSSTEDLAKQIGRASKEFLKAGGTAAEDNKFRVGFTSFMSSERTTYIISKIFNASEVNKLTKPQQVLFNAYTQLGKDATLLNKIGGISDDFVNAGGTLEEAEAFHKAFVMRLDMAGSTALKPFISSLGKGKDVPRLHEIAHDFKNTLNTLRPYSELLLETIESHSRIVVGTP